MSSFKINLLLALRKKLNLQRNNTRFSAHGKVQNLFSRSIFAETDAQPFAINHNLVNFHNLSPLR